MTVLSYLISTRVAADLGVLVLLKGTFVVLAVAAITQLLRTRSAAIRHRIWASCFIVFLTLPFIGTLLPHWNAAAIPYPAETMFVGLAALETVPVNRASDAGGSVEPVHSKPTELSLASALLLVWWAGALVVTVGIASDHLRAHLLRRRCEKPPSDHPLSRLVAEERRTLGIRRHVQLLIARETGLAATLGTIRPVIIISSDLAARPLDELRALVIHELVHVKRRDYLTFLVSAAVMPLYWPNPLVWWARHRTAHERERACDDQVLDSGVRSPLYAKVLLNLSMARAGLVQGGNTTSSFMRLSPTKARIQSILHRVHDRRPLGVMAGAAVATMIVGTALPAASLSVLASTPGTGTIEDLVSALDHQDPTVRERAARTLGRRDPAAVRGELEALLDDSDSGVRLAAIGGLEQLADPRSLPAMAHVLERPFDGGRGEHGFVLKYAIVALGKMGSPEAIQVLEAQLHRPVAQLRWMALETILSMPGGMEAARPHLERFAQSDPSARNRQLASETLVAH